MSKSKGKSKANKNYTQTIDKQVLSLLVCPLSRTSLIISADKKELISLATHLAFPIKNGVPLLSIEEARDLSDEEYHSLL